MIFWRHCRSYCPILKNMFMEHPWSISVYFHDCVSALFIANTSAFTLFTTNSRTAIAIISIPAGTRLSLLTTTHISTLAKEIIYEVVPSS